MVFGNLYQAGLILFISLLNCFSLFAQDGQRDLEYNLRVLEDTISSGQNQVKSLKNELCDNKKDKEKIIQLNKELEKSRGRIAQLENDLEVISGKLHMLIDENNNAETDLNSFRQELSHIKEKADHKDRLLAEYKDKIIAFENENKKIYSLKDKIDNSEQKNKSLLIRIEKLEKDKLMLNNELSSLKKEVMSKDRIFSQEKEKLNNNIDRLNQKISKFKENTKDKDKELVMIKEENLSLKDKQKDFEHLKKELTQAKKMVDNLRRRNDRISVLKKRIKDANKLKQSLLIKIDKITNDLTISCNQVNNLKEEKDNLHKKLSNLKDRIKPIKDKDERINHLEESIKDFSNKQKSLLDKKQKEDKELAYLKNELSRFKNKFTFLEKSYETKVNNSIMDDKDKIIASLKEKIDELSSNQRDFREERNRLLQESDFLKNKVSQLDKNLNGPKVQLNKERKKVLSETNNRRITQLKEQLDAERAMYSRRVAELNIEIEGLKEKLQYVEIRNRQIIKEKNELISHHGRHLSGLSSTGEKFLSYNTKTSSGLRSSKEAAHSLKNNSERKNMGRNGIDKKAVSKENATAGQVVKVYLINGIVLIGKLLEDTKNYIKVERVGIALSYFKDEIKKMEVVKGSK